MRTRNLVRHTSHRFLPLSPGLVVLSIVSACLAFGSDPARAATIYLADHSLEAEFLDVLAVTVDSPRPCSQWISSGPNDPPMLAYLISMQWDYINQVYIGTYQMDGGDEQFRRFNCETLEELEIWP